MKEIAVLGPIQALEGDEPVELGGPTQKRLLATLVAHEGQAVSVAELLDALWGDEPPPSGPATIQSYVSRLRGALGRDVIETTSSGYRLEVDDGQVDAQRFLDISRHLPESPDDRLEAIEEALSLWRGPPFEDFDHVDFASRRLVETRLDLEEEKAGLLSKSGRTSEAIGLLEKVIGEEPFRESAWLALSDALVSAGRPADAIKTLNRYRAKLADIGLEPSSEFEAAESELFAGEVDTPDEDQLPSPVSSFHGRSEDKKQLIAMLEERRVVTVVGPGGMGKTRLALEAVPETNQRKWLVRLEAVEDENKVIPMVLTTLGVETRGEPLVSIVEALRRKPGLLILDNCEHVIDSAAKLADVIGRDTSASVLATSREPLSIPGEAVFNLGPLDPSGAVDLYFDRARSVNRGFSADRSQVELLCSKLDFMPLAIEVAASRSRALGPEEILEKLDQEYGLLDKPRRGKDARHRTLDAMVDWSYRLLPEPTRRAFERVSVFIGDFDLEAASKVAGFDELEPQEVPSHIADLVERSMLESADQRGQYRMLRSFKSFATDQLVESEDWSRAKERHARHYISVAQRIGEGITGPEEVAWVDLANQATEDLGAALQWSIDDDDLDSAQAILEGLFQWFYHRQPPAILGWGDKVLQVASGHPAYSIAGAWAATAAMKRGEIDDALQIASSATEQEPPTSSNAWFIAGDVACYIGDFERSVSSYEESLRRAHRADDAVAVVDALSRLLLSMVRTAAHFEQAMERTSELDDRLAHIEGPSIRSHAEFAIGSAFAGSDLDEAKATLRKAVERARSIENQYVEGMALSELGSVLARDGELDAASDALIEAIDVFSRLGDHPHKWTTIRYLAMVIAKAGSPEVATKLLAAADASGVNPLSSQVSLWSDVFQGLESFDEFDEWTEAGAQMDLEEAVSVALRWLSSGTDSIEEQVVESGLQGT